jgi:hypothetical protein
MGDLPDGRLLPPQDSTAHTDEDKNSCLERDLNQRSKYPSGQEPRLRQRGPFLCILLNIDVIKCLKWGVYLNQIRMLCLADYRLYDEQLSFPWDKWYSSILILKMGEYRTTTNTMELSPSNAVIMLTMVTILEAGHNIERSIRKEIWP